MHKVINNYLEEKKTISIKQLIFPLKSIIYENKKYLFFPPISIIFI